MNKPNFHRALETAASYRHDVKKFSITGVACNYDATMYSGDRIAGAVSWDKYGSETSLRSILDDLIGPEPTLKNEGTRALRARAEREKWLSMTVGETQVE